AVVARPADVVHDLVVAALAEGAADAAADVGQGLLPADPLPAALAPPPGTPQRMEDPLRVADLVERGRALGAVAAPAGGVQRVALEPGDLARVLVDPGHEAAVRLAVEAGGGHQRVVAIHPARPGAGVGHGDVVPGRGVGVGAEPSAGDGPGDGVGHGTGLLYDSGTDWPARTNASS